MKKFILSTTILFGCLAHTAIGQDQVGAVPQPPAAADSRAPDWQNSYHQESARDYIRRRAQEKTAARQARIEGYRWLGYSPSRPVVSTTPFMSSVPSWVPVAPSAYWGGFWGGRTIYAQTW